LERRFVTPPAREVRRDGRKSAGYRLRARRQPVFVRRRRPQSDFNKGKRGPVLPVPRGKERITIRLDCDILDYFRDQVERAGGGNYQTVINKVLRDHVEGKKAAPELEDTLRRVIREELRKVS
jgi:uncharacterized protein (DUF4415 family)